MITGISEMSPPAKSFLVTVSGTPTPVQAQTAMSLAGVSFTPRPFVMWYVFTLVLCALGSFRYEESTRKEIKYDGVVVGYERHYLPPIDTVWFWMVVFFLGLLTFAFVLAYVRAKRDFKVYLEQMASPVCMEISEDKIILKTEVARVELQWGYFTAYKTEGGVTMLFHKGTAITWWSNDWMPQDHMAGVVADYVRSRLPIKSA